MFGSTKRQREMIDENFGIHPLKGRLYYNAESRLHEVERLHKSLRYCTEEENQIDDITWDDLEMNQVFLRINHTESFIGEQKESFRF